jgi:hypothetical protein
MGKSFSGTDLNDKGEGTLRGGQQAGPEYRRDYKEQLRNAPAPADKDQGGSRLGDGKSRHEDNEDDAPADRDKGRAQQAFTDKPRKA